MQSLPRKVGSRIIEFSAPKKKAHQPSAGHIHTKPRLGKQAGWGCKYYAVGNVTQWLYANHAIYEPPLPARKRDLPGSPLSLRQQLKTNHHSQVGEIHNPETFLDLTTKYHEELVATCFECSDEEAYCQILMDAIDNQLVPIVFYRSSNELYPTLEEENSEEHAAILIKYRRHWSGNLFFTTRQLTPEEKDFEIDASMLFHAANSLSDAPISPIKYQKTKRIGKHPSAWYPERFYQIIFGHKSYPPQVIAEKETTDTIQHHGLKNKIVLIDSKHRIDNLIKKLEKKLKAPRFFYFYTTLNNAKKEALSRLKNRLERNENKDVLYTLIEEWKREKNDHGQEHWDVICQPRFSGWLRFFNPRRTEWQALIENTLKTLPNVT